MNQNVKKLHSNQRYKLSVLLFETIICCANKIILRQMEKRPGRSPKRLIQAVI